MFLKIRHFPHPSISISEIFQFQILIKLLHNYFIIGIQPLFVEKYGYVQNPITQNEMHYHLRGYNFLSNDCYDVAYVIKYNKKEE